MFRRRGEGIETIARSHNYIGKHGRKSTTRNFLIVDISCVRSTLLHKCQVDRYPLRLWTSQRKWIRCISVDSGKIFKEVLPKSSNVRLGTLVFTAMMQDAGRSRTARTPILEEGLWHAVDGYTETWVRQLLGEALPPFHLQRIQLRTRVSRRTV